MLGRDLTIDAKLARSFGLNASSPNHCRSDGGKSKGSFIPGEKCNNDSMRFDKK